MSYLNRFFEKVFDESELYSRPSNSFDNANKNQIAAHLNTTNYDSFELTDAVRPAFDLKVKPTQGYRHDVYVDEESQARVPVVMAAASRKTLFPLFIDLIQKLGSAVDVVLESSHDNGGSGCGNNDPGHIDMYREHIDMPVLTSVLWEFEDLLTNDGCTGIAVLNPNTPQEVQFDEHKLLIIYGSPLEQYEHVLECHEVTSNAELQFITEAEHVHSSTEEYARQFERLRTSLGLDSMF